MKTKTKMMRRGISCVLIFLCMLVIVPGMLSIIQTRADTLPYRVTLTANNFGQTLSASALDLSNPGHATFSLQNGTPFWYSVSAQSTPAGITPVAADASDMVTTTFYGATPLLPAVDALPPDFANGHGISLKLAITFTAPNEQIQLTLNPFEAHAALMDTLSLLLRLLGERATGLQIGLLSPGVLKSLFDNLSSMRYLQSLANDYALLLQAVLSDPKNLLQPAYTCARDLQGLLTDTAERAHLADILWQVLGKTLARAQILATLNAFERAQVGLGMVAFFRDYALVTGSALFQQNNPTVVLQSVPNVGSTPTVTPSLPVMPTGTPKVPPVATPTVKPTPTAKSKP